MRRGDANGESGKVVVQLQPTANIGLSGVIVPPPAGAVSFALGVALGDIPFVNAKSVLRTFLKWKSYPATASASDSVVREIRNSRARVALASPAQARSRSAVICSSLRRRGRPMGLPALRAASLPSR